MPKLRGHHLICLHFYDGEGYDEAFIENLEAVVDQIGKEGVRIAEGADDVCSPCPYLNEGSCTFSSSSDGEIREMDRKAITLLGLRPGDHATWDTLRGTVGAVFRSWYETYCLACSWRAACEKNEFFRKLRRGKA